MRAIANPGLAAPVSQKLPSDSPQVQLRHSTRDLTRSIRADRDSKPGQQEYGLHVSLFHVNPGSMAAAE